MVKVVPIVEGHAEQEALPVLLRRIINDREYFHVTIDKPFRIPAGQYFKRETFERRITGVYEIRGGDWLLALYDLEDKCPREYADLKTVANTFLPCRYEQVFAVREYETWFISVKESLRGHHNIKQDSVSPRGYLRIRDAKGVLTDNMEGSNRYIETVHQPKFSGIFPYEEAANKCPSLRRLVTVIDVIAAS